MMKEYGFVAKALDELFLNHRAVSRRFAEAHLKRIGYDGNATNAFTNYLRNANLIKVKTGIYKKANNLTEGRRYKK